MSLAVMFDQLDAIEANVRMIAEEDKDFLNDINNRVCGNETMVITGKEQQRIADIHAKIFGKK